MDSFFYSGFAVVLGFVFLLIGLALLAWFLLQTPERGDWYDRAIWIGPDTTRGLSDPSRGLLALDEDGRVLMPAGYLGNGDPFWLGEFRPACPKHWSVWLRSRRANMVVYVGDGL